MSEPVPTELLAKPIEELGFTTRVSRRLKRGHINTVGELVERRADDLLDLRQFGTGSLSEVEMRLKEHGLTLKPYVRPATLLDTPIEELVLTAWAYSRLKLAGIHTLGQLIDHTQSELLAIPHFGDQTFQEIIELLSALHLTLREDKP